MSMKPNTSQALPPLLDDAAAADVTVNQSKMNMIMISAMPETPAIFSPVGSLFKSMSLPWWDLCFITGGGPPRSES